MVIFTNEALGYEANTQCWWHRTGTVTGDWTDMNSLIFCLCSYCAFTNMKSASGLQPTVRSRTILLVMLPAFLRQMHCCFECLCEGVWISSDLFDLCVSCLRAHCTSFAQNTLKACLDLFEKLFESLQMNFHRLSGIKSISPTCFLPCQYF